MEQLVEFEILILELLLIVSTVAIIVRRFRIPYTVALVLAGLMLSLRPPIQIELTPELILSLLLPPLVFEAAFHLDLKNLQHDLSTIAIQAVPGVILTMIIVGGIVAWQSDLPLPIAFTFGALIAATDPVSVVAIFRKLGAPKRLEVLLEGESLFNDGTAIVVFGLMVEVLRTGEFDVYQSVIDFLRIAGGGALVGLVLGWLVSHLISRIDDYLVETTLTTVLAFGAYLIAERFHFSGVLAVVLAGLVTGNLGERQMSPTTRIVLFNFWEYVAFLANSAVFLIIGLDMDLSAMIIHWQPVLWAVIGVFLSRLIGVYLLTRLGKDMPNRWRHILFWGGLRGAIALALALSLPADLIPQRSILIGMTFGVVLFTLVVQGISMEWLLNRLGLITISDQKIEYELRHARALAERAGLQRLEVLHQDGLISYHTWDQLRPLLHQRVEALSKVVQEILQDAPELEVEEMLIARGETLRAQRSMLGNLKRDGIITDITYEQLVREVDTALDTSTEVWMQDASEDGEMKEVCQLMMVVVQARDLEAASNALAMRNIPVTRIQSSGGFLRQANHLLLVGLPEGKLDLAVDALKRSCRSRVEYLAVPAGDMSLPLGMPVPVQVQGATVFVFDIERCEVF